MKVVRLEPESVADFYQAHNLAREEAQNLLTEPMALAWLNRETGYHSPDVDCCRTGDKESWEIYAENRGGSLRVEVGNRFVFIFREGAV